MKAIAAAIIALTFTGGAASAVFYSSPTVSSFPDATPQYRYPVYQEAPT